ncbi:hypothetical protein Agabi119p4_5437 [Agaricus bisporus var. burnettii]|uniref:Uncharacterized protein n=1 Tax=Agaricus bisporus var. burnettii TaxID=192524 RepID=A0A8H7F1T6_AGABI|nr:hypothetical protein Agabi119p4_5437 [Agaricus bisporus var. burnettii]
MLLPATLNSESSTGENTAFFRSFNQHLHHFQILLFDCHFYGHPTLASGPCTNIQQKLDQRFVSCMYGPHVFEKRKWLVTVVPVSTIGSRKQACILRGSPVSNKANPERREYRRGGIERGMI